MKRTRTHPAIVRYGIYLYFSSRNFRLIASCLSSIIKRSHVSIWKSSRSILAVQTEIIKYKQTCSQKKDIFVDETLFQIDGQDYWLWIAYEEPNLYACMMLLHLSRERTIFVCYRFFKQLLNRYDMKPIFTDGAQWYNDACK